MLLLCCSLLYYVDDDCLGVVVLLSNMSLLAPALSLPHSFFFYIFNTPSFGKAVFFFFCVCCVRRLHPLFPAQLHCCLSAILGSGQLKSNSFRFPLVSHSNHMWVCMYPVPVLPCFGTSLAISDSPPPPRAPTTHESAVRFLFSFPSDFFFLLYFFCCLLAQ